MKKLIITVLTIFLINTSFSQIFDGIQISGDFNSTLEKFKSKGYIVEDLSAEGAILSLKKIEVNLLKTPKTNKVFKAAVYFPKKNNWADLKSEFNKYYILFIQRHGRTSDRDRYFDAPYYEGDGNEMEALTTGNCKYWYYWESVKGATYYIEISKYKQVKITYENDANVLLKDKEISDLDSQF